MEYKLELVLIPVSDVDRAKEFYVEKCGFKLDVDHQPNDQFRVVQITPPGSACSLTIGKGLSDAAPGSYRGTHLVVTDIVAARDELVGRGVSVSEVRHMTPSGWQPGPDPRAPTTGRSPTSAIPTATPGSCRKSNTPCDERDSATETLVDAATAGDSAAFAEVTERHRRELHVHCYRMLASFDEAEDAVQETFLRAWRGRERFDGSSLFRAWLYRIATNVCLDMRRRSARRIRSWTRSPKSGGSSRTPTACWTRLRQATRSQMRWSSSARRSSSRSWPHCRFCRRDSARRCSRATCSVGRPSRPRPCSRRASPPPTARCSEPARRCTRTCRLGARTGRLARRATRSERCSDSSSMPTNAATPRPRLRSPRRTSASRCHRRAVLRRARDGGATDRARIRTPARRRLAAGADVEPIECRLPPATCVGPAIPSSEHSSSTCCGSKTALSRRSRPSASRCSQPSGCHPRSDHRRISNHPAVRRRTDPRAIA